MPIEFHRDGPWDLPEGWVWARLGQLGRWTGGGTPSKANAAFWANGTIPWVSPKDMKVDVIGDTEDLITSDAVVRSATKLVAENSILMVVRSGILKHTFPVALTDRNVTINQDMRALSPPDGINARFLTFVLRRLQRQILDECSKDGTTVASVEPALLEKILVPIPPAAEQRRIVARIDELFTDIADGETTLTRARDDLDTWRRALLKAAVTGELTSEWREHNKSNESALNLLVGLGRSPTEVNKSQQSLDAISARGVDSPVLPDTWVWTTLGEISESVRNGFSIAPRAERNEHEILRISAVRPRFIDLSQIRYLTAEQAKAANTFKVQSGDFLFTRYNGSADLVGVGALYLDSPRYYPDKLIRVRLRPELRNYASYFEVAVNTWISRKHIAANIKTTAGQQGLSGEALKNTPIPLPPPAEAVAIIDAIADVGSDAITELRSIAHAPSSLRKSVLKAAFEGRLVDQDPRDEPANVLLARLNENTVGPQTARAGNSLTRRSSVVGPHA